MLDALKYNLYQTKMSVYLAGSLLCFRAVLNRTLQKENSTNRQITDKITDPVRPVQRDAKTGVDFRCYATALKNTFSLDF